MKLKWNSKFYKNFINLNVQADTEFHIAYALMISEKNRVKDVDENYAIIYFCKFIN